MTDWVRLWHDMPTDPKWRVIARKSGQPLPCVIALFTLMMTSASAAADRGSIAGLSIEDAAAALDMDEDDVSAIIEAMDGRVVSGGRLSGWERRQPKREDSSTGRVRAHRERVSGDVKRDETQCNAPDTDTDTDTDTEEDTPSSLRSDGEPATAQILRLEEPRPPDKSKSVRGQRLPADWSPSPDVIAVGREEGLTDEQIERELRQFRDYWAGIPGDRGRKLDWGATARNWLRKASSRLPQARLDGAGRNRSPPVSTLELYRGAVAKVSNSSGLS